MTLELRAVGKTVAGEVHIHPTDLTLEPGSFNILLGTTLAGKTTLMQLMAGLERPTEGRVFFDGQDVTGWRVQDRNVSMVYQQFINYPNYSVYDNIASPLRVAKVSESEIKTRVGAMADLLRLTPMLNRRPSELSGGQQQRTAMARALVKHSSLVLLDEPLANLDFKLREELREELPRLFADRDCIVVYATTEPVEALLFGGHTATMSEGRVTQFGPTGDLYRLPDDLISAQVFSEPPINVAPIEKRGGDIRLGDSVTWRAPATLSSEPDGPLTLGLRPHHVRPTPGAEGAVPVSGAVKVSELSGSETVIHFQLGADSWVSQSQGIHSVGIGETATFYADMAQAFYFRPDGRRVGVGGA
jgi:glycerol transport system ATP-binding protein